MQKLSENPKFVQSETVFVTLFSNKNQQDHRESGAVLRVADKLTTQNSI